MDVLVVGAGVMGRNHVRTLSAERAVESILVLEPSEASRAAIPREYAAKVRFVESLEDAIAREPDCAIVASSTPTHFPLAHALLSAGVPTLVEKPMTDDLEKGAQLVRLAEEKNTVLMAGHVERFNPAVQTLKEHVGLIGEIVYASTHRFGIPAKRNVGSVFFDQAVHDVDVLLFLTGERPVAVQATARRVLDETDNDICSAIYEFPSFIASIEANRVTPIRTRELVLLGVSGSARLQYITQELSITRSDGAVAKTNTFDEIVTVVGRGTEVRPYFQKEEPLKREVGHFLECVRTGSPPIVTGTDGLMAVAAMEAGIAASDAKKRMEISYPSVRA